MTDERVTWDALHDFRRWMRRRMATRGITQRQLATRSGVDHSTVSRLIGGSRQDPLLSTALKLVEALLTEDELASLGETELELDARLIGEVIHDLKWCKASALLHSLAHDDSDEDGYRARLEEALRARRDGLTTS